MSTTWIVILTVFYVLIGLDNVLESPSCGSGFWCCWDSKAAAFFLWPLDALVAIGSVLVSIAGVIMERWRKGSP